MDPEEAEMLAMAMSMEMAEMAAVVTAEKE